MGVDDERSSSNYFHLDSQVSLGSIEEYRQDSHRSIDGSSSSECGTVSLPDQDASIDRTKVFSELPAGRCGGESLNLLTRTLACFPCFGLPGGAEETAQINEKQAPVVVPSDIKTIRSLKKEMKMAEERIMEQKRQIEEKKLASSSFPRNGGLKALLERSKEKFSSNRVVQRK